MLINQMRILLFGFFALALASCSGSGGEGNTSTGDTNSSPMVPAISATPSPETLSLEITLRGEAVTYLNVGDEYADMGATVFDENGEETVVSIALTGNVNTGVAGDYLLKYNVSDSGLSGSAIRIVRVAGNSPVRQTQRLNTSAGTNLSYLEHLPVDYATSTNPSAPLIIFNHGSGATGASRLSAVECCGLPRVLDALEWDDSLPFVVLSPHRDRGLDYEELNEFVEFALEHYAVDPNRVYMTGWSQGGHISLLYAIAYPEKVAALAPLAGGLFSGIPENICDAEDIPMWMYLGGRDSNIIRDAGVNTVNALNNCAQVPEKRLTTLPDANHFDTSISPFLEQGTDPMTENLLEWLLSNSN